MKKVSINKRDLSVICRVAHEWYLDFKMSSLSSEALMEEMDFLRKISMNDFGPEELSLFVERAESNLRNPIKSIRKEAKRVLKILKNRKDIHKEEVGGGTIYSGDTSSAVESALKAIEGLNDALLEYEEGSVEHKMAMAEMLLILSRYEPADTSDELKHTLVMGHFIGKLVDIYYDDEWDGREAVNDLMHEYWKFREAINER